MSIPIKPFRTVRSACRGTWHGEGVYSTTTTEASLPSEGNNAEPHLSLPSFSRDPNTPEIFQQLRTIEAFRALALVGDALL